MGQNSSYPKCPSTLPTPEWLQSPPSWISTPPIFVFPAPEWALAPPDWSKIPPSWLAAPPKYLDPSSGWFGIPMPLLLGTVFLLVTQASLMYWFIQRVEAGFASRQDSKPPQLAPLPSPKEPQIQVGIKTPAHEVYKPLCKKILDSMKVMQEVSIILLENHGIDSPVGQKQIGVGMEYLASSTCAMTENEARQYTEQCQESHFKMTNLIMKQREKQLVLMNPPQEKRTGELLAVEKKSNQAGETMVLHFPTLPFSFEIFNFEVRCFFQNIFSTLG